MQHSTTIQTIHVSPSSFFRRLCPASLLVFVCYMSVPVYIFLYPVLGSGPWSRELVRWIMNMLPILHGAQINQKHVDWRDCFTVVYMECLEDLCDYSVKL